ncbi:MAG: hypothetical protein JNL11_19730 [Bdellovibrionaceae bacterium]|nr:hypothetical protein [Pseudobdellovibrionaceae bacterium]
MKILLVIFFLALTTLASHFQITINRGHFKNGYSLAEAPTKMDTIYLLNHISNGEVRKFTVLTEKTFQSMKTDFLHIVEALKVVNQRKIASCEESVTIKTQGKEKWFCSSQLPTGDSRELEAWLDKARFYTGLKKNKPHF